ncbi:thiolase family protein [Sphingopyxis granuli]|uniref:thiolase family protein n=1 Tax=Sphingopyxis granuli TaxID=267128 RepID=UPI001BAFA0B4|nr:thiolase family protein [Sphingopyxis granuli]QUM73983.1 thiolase family protein [Sphingopyxis granuli]
MRRPLRDYRPVHVVGIGLHRFQPLSETTYVELGLTAIREAMADAGIAFSAIDSAYCGTALLGMAPSRAMLRHLGASGLPITQVENASASGSTAVRQAVLEVASGMADVSLAIGLDKPAPIRLAHEAAGVPDLVNAYASPFTHFALLADDYMRRYGVTAEQVARVAEKNFRNASKNPHAHRQKGYSLAEILSGPNISGPLTRLQCCPIGEGAAAVIVASDDAIARLGLSRARSVRVLSSTSRSERVYDPGADPDTELTRETLAMSCAEAGVSPGDLDVVEFHDGFSIEELLYVEALGVCAPGQAAGQLARGDFDIGGRVAINPSGGLLAMGHPIGPTGVGQICEIARQLRGEAGPRQQPGARLGLAHMVGIGSVCVVHILSAAD